MMGLNDLLKKLKNNVGGLAMGLTLALTPVYVSGCADGDVNNSVDGVWCGRDVQTAEQCVGGEVEYLDLHHSGNIVTGKVCESYNRDCNRIRQGIFQNGQLNFTYNISGSDDSVDGEFILSENGEMLKGYFYSTKCDCESDLNFYHL